MVEYFPQTWLSLFSYSPLVTPYSPIAPTILLGDIIFSVGALYLPHLKKTIYGTYTKKPWQILDPVFSFIGIDALAALYIPVRTMVLAGVADRVHDFCAGDGFTIAFHNTQYY